MVVGNYIHAIISGLQIDELSYIYTSVYQSVTEYVSLPPE